MRSPLLCPALSSQQPSSARMRSNCGDAFPERWKRALLASLLTLATFGAAFPCPSLAASASKPTAAQQQKAHQKAQAAKAHQKAHAKKAAAYKAHAKKAAAYKAHAKKAAAYKAHAKKAAAYKAHAKKAAAYKAHAKKAAARQNHVARARLSASQTRLVAFSTVFNPKKAKRTLNMRLAIRAINGKVIPSGGVFSLNGAVGERTQARGYRTAIIFKNRKKVFDLGGGVSQVTGALFNAAVLAGLPIVQYRTHTRPVHYLPIGRDATVSWGHFDMKFRNNTSAPLRIRYTIRGDRITASLFGKKTPGQKVSLAVRQQKVGPNHIQAQLYRTFRRNGRVVKKELVGRSDYNWKDETPD